MAGDNSCHLGGAHDQPLVSVIMSVYNCEATLAEAVESIFDQTYTNWEFIVCDDASTDSTLELLTQLAERDRLGRVKIITNTTNMRLAYSLNRCLEVASGELIARMDGDDISEPDRLARQVEYLAEHPEIALVGSSVRRFSQRGEAEVVHPAAAAPDKWTMARTSKAPFTHGTIMVRRETFDRIGNYTVVWRTQRGQDADLWFKIFAAGFVGHNLPEPLYKVREDAAAIRRRTPLVRLRSFLTYVKGARSLGYGPSAYVRAAADLMKIFVPYFMIDRYRAYTAQRSLKHSDQTTTSS